VEGARIRLGEMRAPQAMVRTRTDLDGSYAIGALAPGPCHFAIDFFTPAGDLDECVHFNVDLVSGEDQRLDYGIARPWPHWRGVLRTRTGAEHRGEATLLLRKRKGNPRLITRALAGEGFDLRVPPGRYDALVKLHERDSHEHEVGEIEIGEEDLQQDLVLLGARVRGRVYLAETGAAITDRARDLEVSVRPEGHDYGSALRRARVDAQGSFAIDGLEPGTYLFNAYPLVVAGGSDSLRFVLLPGQDELVLEVGLRPR
jgi:hypothetical protein